MAHTLHPRLAELSTQPRRSSACADRVLRSEQSGREYKAFRYLIIGAGSAATSAVKAIRETDQTSEILLIGDTVQKTLPFHKPPLSDSLRSSQPSADPSTSSAISPTYTPILDFSDVDDEVKDDGNIVGCDPKLTHYRHLHAKSIDSATHRVTLTDGTTFEYDSALIATGGSPNTPPCFQALKDQYMTYRTINDYKQLKEVCKRVKSVCIIGSGLLASELASSISNIGIHVIQLFDGPGIYYKLLPKYLSDYVTSESEKRGIEIKSGSVVDAMRKPNSHTLVLNNGEKVDAEFTVICAGRQPNVEIAESAGLPISGEDGGVLVDPTLEVVPDIFAAGDIISWKDPIFRQHRRVDYHDHAIHSGEIAGKNMSGLALEYSHQPFFWSDLGFLAFEAVGLIDSRLSTVGVWKAHADAAPLILLGDASALAQHQFKTGFVYYLDGQHIVGILLVGMFGKLEQARAMIIQRRITIHKPEDCKNLISFVQ